VTGLLANIDVVDYALTAKENNAPVDRNNVTFIAKEGCRYIA
jgi:hypothetical protein